MQLRCGAELLSAVIVCRSLPKTNQTFLHGQLHLQQVIRHNLILFGQQFLHVQGPIDETARKPGEGSTSISAKQCL